MPGGNGQILGVSERTTSTFSYLVAGGEQTAYEYLNLDAKSRRLVADLDYNAFTAARVITVRVYVKIDATNYRCIDTKDYTIGTNPYNPHVDFTTFRSLKITMQISVVEVGNITVQREVMVQRVEG